MFPGDVWQGKAAARPRRVAPANRWKSGPARAPESGIETTKPEGCEQIELSLACGWWPILANVRGTRGPGGRSRGRIARCCCGRPAFAELTTGIRFARSD